MLPNVIDPLGSSYSITARLLNRSEIPSWIEFDSRKFTITPPKSASTGKNILMNL